MGSQNKEKATSKLEYAATKLFAEKGYHETSVRDISKLAGVNPSLINYHFGGKEELYRSILGQAGEDSSAFYEKFVAECDSYQEFVDRFKLLVEEIVTRTIKHFDVQRMLEQVMNSQNSVGKEIVRNKYLSIVENIIRFIQNGLNKGYVKESIDPRMVALLIVAFSRNVSLTRGPIKEYMELDVEDPSVPLDIAEAFLNMVLPGLLSEPKES